MKIDQSQAECFVYTSREGALSAIGHDLKLKVGRFSLEFDNDQVTGEFAADSLQVVGAMSHGTLDSGAISSKDKGKIEKNILKDVLKTKKNPQIRYEGSVDRSDAEIKFTGTLSLMGQKRGIGVVSSLESGTWVSRTTVDQSQFGMPQFKAILGQLRVNHEVLVELRIPEKNLN